MSKVLSKSKLILASPRGFCAGVERAVEILQRAIDLLGAPVYVKHEVVHNKTVVEELKNLGAIFVEDIERYYSFNQNGYHFIVLDGNDENPKPWNEYYNRYIGPNQKKWLVEDLKKSYLPTIIFSHQSLDSKGGIFNQHEIRKIIEDSIFVNGNKKVVACICGHHHDDYLKIINDIAYVHINSASYKWVGEKYKFSRFSKMIENDFPSIVKTCPYKKPLFTTMHINSKQKRKTNKLSNIL